jgi:hypothetical protein
LNNSERGLADDGRNVLGSEIELDNWLVMHPTRQTAREDLSIRWASLSFSTVEKRGAPCLTQHGPEKLRSAGDTS